MYPQTATATEKIRHRQREEVSKGIQQYYFTVALGSFVSRFALPESPTLLKTEMKTLQDARTV